MKECLVSLLTRRPRPVVVEASRPMCGDLPSPVYFPCGYVKRYPTEGRIYDRRARGPAARARGCSRMLSPCPPACREPGPSSTVRAAVPRHRGLARPDGAHTGVAQSQRGLCRSGCDRRAARAGPADWALLGRSGVRSASLSRSGIGREASPSRTRLRGRVAAASAPRRGTKPADLTRSDQASDHPSD